MKRRACVAWLLAAGGGAAQTRAQTQAQTRTQTQTQTQNQTQTQTQTQAQISDAERARINRLIDAVGQRKDIRFVRNGKEYTAAQAADFLRGKLQWNIEKVRTAKEFIAEVGTRSTTSGQAYLVRMADGRTLPSAEFLAQELRRIDKR